jgi:hypothetical protein
MVFQTDVQPEMADQALSMAHNCILNVLEVQNQRFKIDGLGEQLQTCLRDYLEIWVPDSVLLTDTGQTPATNPSEAVVGLQRHAARPPARPECPAKL